MAPRRDDHITELMAKLSPPDDRRSGGAWDEYWRWQLSMGVARMFDMMVHDRELVAVMREEGLRRVLVGGNGVSVEPRALAAAGFDVVAVDISPLALKAAQHFELAGDRLANFIGDGAEETGGRLAFLEGDLFEPTFCAGPYDVIIERRTVQGYPESERATLLSSLAARLTPHGILVSHCHDGSWRPGRKRRHVTGDWFRANGWNTVHSLRDRRSGMRTALLVSSTG